MGAAAPAPGRRLWRTASLALLVLTLAHCEPLPGSSDPVLEARWLATRALVAEALARGDPDDAQQALRSFQGEIARAEERSVATAEELDRARRFLALKMGDVEAARERLHAAAIEEQVDTYLAAGSFGLARSHLRLCLYGAATPPAVEAHCQALLARVEEAELAAIEGQIEDDLAREAFQKARGLLGVHLNAGEFSEEGRHRLAALLARVDEAERGIPGPLPPPPPPDPQPVPAPPPVPVPAPAPPPPTHDLGVFGLRFVEIPAGRYAFGTPEGEAGRDGALEATPAELPVEGFFISTTEVTQEAFARVLPRSWDRYAGPRLPAHSVTFEEARAFCRLLSQRDPTTVFSLPTEVEWEVAARALRHPEEGPVAALPEHRERFRGDLDQAAQALQNYAVFSANKVGPGPVEVGQKMPNPLGLRDLHGNVAEWCLRESRILDWYRGVLVGQPLRGGSVQSSYERCRAGARALEPETSRKTTIGFRVIARRR